MPSQLESELHNRFSHLLKPIRDLTKNWDVDVAAQLEEYIDEVHTQPALVWAYETLN